MDINKCNENQYNNNINILLVILLILVLLKCNKAKQKYEDISNGLQGEHIFNEDAQKVTSDLEVDSDYLNNKRIKANIEKAKIKMLIKELESSIEPVIHLEKVNRQITQPLERKKQKEWDKEELKEQNMEESKEVNIEELKEVNIEESKEVNIEESKEVNIEESKEVNIEESKEVNIEESKEVNIEESKEVNIEESKEVNIEESKEVNIEESKEVNIEDLKEVNIEESKEVNIEESKEVNIEDLKEVNIEKSKELYKEKQEKEILEEGDEKNLEDMKDLAQVSFGGYVMPMEVILKQLVGENITFSTAAGINEFKANPTLLSVKDGIVHIDISDRILSIPICEIVGVESNLIHSIDIQSLVDISTKELYEYKEWSLRSLFSTMIGEKVFIETTGSGSFNRINDKTVTNLGEGIVVLDNTMAISLNKIILVERR